LHVIGRTYSMPHKYFYRRYQHQMWTPWEPVSAEIEGDHVVAVVWRQRLHLFWVTFMEKAKQDLSVMDSSGNNKPLQETTLNEITTMVSNAAPNKQVEVQLHWSEYFQGQWTTR